MNQYSHFVVYKFKDGEMVENVNSVIVPAIKRLSSSYRSNLTVDHIGVVSAALPYT